MKKKKFIIGIDVGGTSIKFGLVEKNIIRKEFSLPTYAFENPQKVLGQIELGLKQLLNKISNEDIEGIGIGFPGKVNAEKGIVTSAPNFNNWKNIQVRKKLLKFGFPVFIDNDANCAALGELYYGRGRKLNNFIMVTLGTGVGGGIIINKKLFHGDSGGAGEIGHITIDYSGPFCKCGKRGCVEAYAGNSYIKQRTIQKLHEYPESLILKLVDHNLDNIEPKIINEAAQKGDELAIKILKETGFYIGIGLANIANTLDIKNFVIGGGISNAGPILLKSIENSIKEHGIRDIVKDVKVYSAQLKNKAGILGAASLVLGNMSKK
ncbi:MAG: ROK family protein [Ignavibacteria bacterium]|nr:ROK family protein [Ignavibacteria bacterium]